MVFTENRRSHSPQNINIVIVCCHERLFSIITIFTAVPVLVVVVVVVPVVVVVVPVVVVKRAIFSWLLFLNVLKTQVRWLCLQRNTYGWILTPGFRSMPRASNTKMWLAQIRTHVIRTHCSPLHCIRQHLHCLLDPMNAGP